VDLSDMAAADGSKDYMSIYLADGMQANGKSLADLQDHWGPGYKIVEFTAVELRAAGEEVWRDDDENFPGHGACKRADGSKRTAGQKKALARLSRPAER
jgi:hypothetical protein